MMTPQQIEVLDLLQRILTRTPEIRVGQLIDWAAFLARPSDHQPTSNIEDHELVAALFQHLENLEQADADRPLMIEPVATRETR